MSDKLTVHVVSAEKEIWSGNAQMVVAKTVEGEIGILSNHEPMLAILSESKVRIISEVQGEINVDASEGYISVDSDVITIIAGKAMLLSS